MLRLLLCAAAFSAASQGGVTAGPANVNITASPARSTNLNGTGNIQGRDLDNHQTDDEDGDAMNKLVGSDSEHNENDLHFAHQNDNGFYLDDIPFTGVTPPSDTHTMMASATEWRRLCPEVVQFEDTQADSLLDNWPAVRAALSRCCARSPQHAEHQPPPHDSVNFICTLNDMTPGRAAAARSTDTSDGERLQTSTSGPVNNSDDSGLTTTEKTSMEVRTVSPRVEQNDIMDDSWELTEADLKTATKGSLEKHFLFLQKLKLKLVSEVLNFKKRLIKMVIA